MQRYAITTFLIGILLFTSCTSAQTIQQTPAPEPAVATPSPQTAIQPTPAPQRKARPKSVRTVSQTDRKRSPVTRYTTIPPAEKKQSQPKQAQPAVTPPAQPEPVQVPRPVITPSALTLADVAALARRLAWLPYEPPKTVPSFLTSLSFENWTNIRCKDDHDLNAPASRFSARFHHPGAVYQHCIRIHTISDDGTADIAYAPDLFEGLDKAIANDVHGTSTNFAGFGILRKGTETILDRRIATFLGATYFRGATDNGVYGTSALAITENSNKKTLDFPRFTEFWIVTPHKDDACLTIYALMDSPQVTGAYRFVLLPGKCQVMDVTCTLFRRVGADSDAAIGIAPLCGMFLRDTEGAAVHDADTLAFKSGTTTVISPLVNPRRLDVTTFSCGTPQFFGLLQREARASTYAPATLPYAGRPSVFVKPLDDWGKGELELTQIPTNTAVNNNILLAWIPEQPRIFKPDETTTDKTSYRYRLVWTQNSVEDDALAHVSQSRVDLSPDGDSATFSVTFSGGKIATATADTGFSCPLTLPEGVSCTKKLLSHDEATHSWTLSFTVDLPRQEGILNALLPSRNSLPPLRFSAFMNRGDNLPEPLTEQWTYDLRR